MKFPRRRFLQLAASAVGVSGSAPSVFALDYPSRPVRILEGFGGGGTPDLLWRLIGQWLSQRLGQPFFVENRTGAGGNIATEAVIAAAPDSYALLAVTGANAINASLYARSDFDFIHDIAPVAGTIRFPMVLLINPWFPASTFAEFIAYAKANPGKVNIASPGIGTPMHVAIELFKVTADIDIVHLPYRGPAAAFTDLMGGQIQAFVITVSAALGFIKNGKLRALAVTGPNRIENLPDVPSVREALPGFEASAWDGLGAPKTTPTAIVDLLNSNITAALADPRVKARINYLGGEIVPMTPQQFGRFVADETDKWAKVVKFAGVKAD